jgi:hypothetical protein
MAFTEAQKDENKKARKERDRAYRARYKAWSSARSEALASLPLTKEEATPSSSPSHLSLAAWASSDALDAVLHAVRAEEDSIRAKIMELTVALEGVSARHNQSAVAAARRAAYEALSAARKEAEAVVDANFSDVAHIYSATVWGTKSGFGQQKA